MDIEGILAIVMVFSIPLLAIGGSYFLRYKKMQIQQREAQGIGASNALLSSQKVYDLEMALERVSADNANLRKRLENVEALVGSVAWDELAALPKQLDTTEQDTHQPPQSDKTVG